MSIEKFKDVALICEDRMAHTARRLGVMLVRNPAEGLRLPADIVRPVHPPLDSEIARQYPGCNSFLDGRKGDHRPFVFATYLLQPHCNLSLDELADKIKENLPDYDTVVLPENDTMDFLNVYCQEHQKQEVFPRAEEAMRATEDEQWDF